MKAPAPDAPVDRTLDDVLNDLDGHLFQIKQAAEIVLEAAIAADINPDVYSRLSFGAKVVTDYTEKAETCSDEAFDIARQVSAVLKK